MKRIDPLTTTMKYVSDTQAGRAISAWVILNKRNQHVATVQAHFGSVITVNVFNHPPSKTPGEAAGRAGGYGYDKLTAALAGLVVDGHKLSNHCGENRPGLYDGKTPAPKGWQYANWTSWEWDGSGNRVDLPSEKQGYTDCYRISGLEYLSAIGYQVIKAI